MKKLFYRLSSRRPLAGLFSMHAQLEKRRRVIMCSSKLISALVFAVFTFYFSGAARAQCDNPDFCSDPGIPVTVDNITGSSIKCNLEPGGASQPFNKLDIGTGFGTSTATFTQNGTATCTQFPDKGKPISLGVCIFEATWTGVITSACNAADNTFTARAFCMVVGL